MFNIVVSLLTVGVISSSGATYLLTLEQQTKEVANHYQQQAEVRFDEYDKILPGIVKYTP